MGVGALPAETVLLGITCSLWSAIVLLYAANVMLTTMSVLNIITAYKE